MFGLSSAASRRALAMLIVALIAAVFVVRLVDLQVIHAAEHAADSLERRAVPVTIPALRGNIVDRNGTVLATTDERYDVQISPKNSRLNNGIFMRFDEESGQSQKVTLKQALQEISEITGQDVADLEKIIDDALADNPKSDFAYLKRSVDLTTLNKLKELEIPWMTFASIYNRTYPNGAVAGNIIGFVGSEGQAQAGIELAQDACLAGVNGSETYERSAQQIRLPGSTVVTEEAVDGGQVQLTIDTDLQWQAQQIINQIQSETEAEWAMQVIMDVKTGELLAVAEDQSVDPNDVDAADADRRDARAFIYPYEPGSTFKTITAAALIDSGKADALTQNMTPGRWDPEEGVTFADAWAHGDTPWTLTGIIAHSSNVGTAMLGNRLTPEERYNYMTKFGVGQSTNAGMPFEEAGLLYNWQDWDPQTKYNVMFGQGVSSTIVQTASIYQAIANGGLRVPPKIVKSCTDENGEVTEHDAGATTQVISPEAAKETIDILEAVTNVPYTKQWVEVPGYRTAGKTGTAQQTDGQGGYRSDYIYSFAGMLPAENPQYVIVTSVAYPAKAKNGAQVGFKRSAEALIRHYHLAPSTQPYEPLPLEY